MNIKLTSGMESKSTYLFSVSLRMSKIRCASCTHLESMLCILSLDISKQFVCGDLAASICCNSLGLPGGVCSIAICFFSTYSLYKEKMGCVHDDMFDYVSA